MIPLATVRTLSVLVVDDSAVVRQALSAILSQDRDMIVTVAADPVIALDKMGRFRPDVIVLDLEMPRMDGLTFLRRIMSTDPIPVVVCSGLATRGTEAAIRALECGAVEVIAKPTLGVQDFLHNSGDTLVEIVRAAASARVKRRSDLAAPVALRPAPPHGPARPTSGRIVAIGASTGGPEALHLLLEAQTPESPGIVVVQHMPEKFTAAFAHRLNETCRIEVKEAETGDRVSDGRALIAPGGRHMRVLRSGHHYLVEVSDGPQVSGHRPSVDVLFRSVAQAAGAHAIGVICTGMGNDGAAGLLEMRQRGATTIAQDEATSVVFGMPKEAIELGAAAAVLPLSAIPSALTRLLSAP